MLSMNTKDLKEITIKMTADKPIAECWVCVQKNFKRCTAEESEKVGEFELAFERRGRF